MHIFNCRRGDGIILSFLSHKKKHVQTLKTSNGKSRRILKKDYFGGGKDMYGYKIVNRKLVLIPEQAELVKGFLKCT